MAIRIYDAQKSHFNLTERSKKAVVDLLASFFLVRSLLVRDLRAKYRQTLLGFLGALWPPFVSTFVFVFLNTTQLLNVETGDTPYVVFAFTGSVFWTFFIETIHSPVNEFLNNTSMLVRLDFPREAIILKGVFSAIVNLAIKLLFWFFLLFFFDVSITEHMFGVLLVILNLSMSATAIGLLLMPFIVIYRDLQQIINSAISFGMYLTPVMYPVAQLKYFGAIAAYNPLTNIFDFMRNCVFNGSFELYEYNIVFLLVSAVFILVGWTLYRISIPFLIERMQA